MDKILKHKNDLILIGVILILAAVGFIILKLTAENGNTVKVSIDGEVKYTYNLNDSVKEIIYTQQNGNYNTLVIQNGKAYIESADCPDKICVSHNKISNKGETIVCLPHRLVVSVE